MPDCNDCGDPATVHAYAGKVRTANGWRTARVWLCEACAAGWEYERVASVGADG